MLRRARKWRDKICNKSTYFRALFVGFQGGSVLQELSTFQVFAEHLTALSVMEASPLSNDRRHDDEYLRPRVVLHKAAWA